MIRKIISIVVLSILFISGIYAQKQYTIRGGGNFNTSFPNQGLGFGGDIDLRYNIFNNLNAGIKIGKMYSVRNFWIDKTEIQGSATASMVNSYLLHSDFYFNYGRSIFAPYIGGGFGFYQISNLKLEVDENPDYSSLINFAKDLKTGALIRAGIEITWFRLGLEYNFIPRSDLYNITKTVVGTTPNSYFAITAGFYIGNGWEINY